MYLVWLSPQPRRYPELSLKPVKVSRRRHDTSSTTLSSTNSLVSLDGAFSTNTLPIYIYITLRATSLSQYRVQCYAAWLTRSAELCMH